MKESIGKDESRLIEIDIMIKELEAEKINIEKRVSVDKKKV